MSVQSQRESYFTNQSSQIIQHFLIEADGLQYWQNVRADFFALFEQVMETAGPEQRSHFTAIHANVLDTVSNFAKQSTTGSASSSSMFSGDRASSDGGAASADALPLETASSGGASADVLSFASSGSISRVAEQVRGAHAIMDASISASEVPNDAHSQISRAIASLETSDTETSDLEDGIAGSPELHESRDYLANIHLHGTYAGIHSDDLRVNALRALIGQSSLFHKNCYILPRDRKEDSIGRVLLTDNSPKAYFSHNVIDKLKSIGTVSKAEIFPLFEMLPAESSIEQFACQLLHLLKVNQHVFCMDLVGDLETTASESKIAYCARKASAFSSHQDAVFSNVFTEFPSLLFLRTHGKESFSKSLKVKTQHHISTYSLVGAFSRFDYSIAFSGEQQDAFLCCNNKHKNSVVQFYHDYWEFGEDHMHTKGYFCTGYYYELDKDSLRINNPMTEFEDLFASYESLTPERFQTLISKLETVQDVFPNIVANIITPSKARRTSATNTKEMDIFTFEERLGNAVFIALSSLNKKRQDSILENWRQGGRENPTLKDLSKYWGRAYHLLTVDA